MNMVLLILNVLMLLISVKLVLGFVKLMANVLHFDEQYTKLSYIASFTALCMSIILIK